ncbi:MAG: hypothetical protein AABY91_06835 [Gemmatimonadota bacterium]
MANRPMTGTTTAWLALALIAGGCGGADVEEPATPVPAGSQRAAAGADSARQEVTGPLRREVFAYTGGARDPFESLLDQANVGPELPDLTLVGVYVDHQNGSRNVAVLRERITGRRYNLHPGDRLGRLQVIDIREREISFLIDDFGIERRETLSLRKSQEEQTP